MDRRLVTGGLAAAAAVALGVVGSTYSAFSDYADVPGNRVNAGVLLLDVGDARPASATVTFADLVPGTQVERLIWVANDAQSTPDGTLALTLHNAVDVAAPCAVSRGKAEGEIESGISGCVVDGDAVVGTPAQGNLSRVVEVAVAYTRSDAQSCVGDAQSTVLDLGVTGRGNLYAVAAANRGSGTTALFRDGAQPLILSPGQGLCVGLRMSWPLPSAPPDPSHPTDNAAQADSVTVDLRFDLTQVES